MIEYLEHDQINKQEWDQLNERPLHSSFYNSSEVLDIASPDWSALVDRETGHVMPLTCRKKIGFRYLYQPIGLQRLGVHGPNADEHLPRFLEAIPDHFVLWDISVAQRTVPAGVQHVEATNCILQLDRAYAELAAEFSTNHKRNLKTQIPVVESISVRRFMECYANTSAKRFGVSVEQQEVIQRLLTHVEACDSLQLLGLAGTQCAVAMIKWKNTLIFFKSCNDERGRKIRGLFHLVDQVIKDQEGQDIVLDFAGSDDPNTQRFYTGFGAKTHVYLRLKYNVLPFPFRFLK